MRRFCIICRDATLRVSLLAVIIGIGLPAHAWDNDYQATNTYDNYSQSWQNYKQQNNINTQPVYQQSWWNSAVNSVSNFFADVGSAVNNVLNNIGNFFTSVYNNVYDFFIKPSETKTNLATAPPVGKDAVSDAGVINHAPTLDTKQNLSTNISDTVKADSYKTQTTQKDNPYAYLTAEKACYDPRAAGLPEMSDAYQAIVKEYDARDKWVADQQAQSEGKLVDSTVGAGLAPARTQDSDAINRVSTISQPAAISKNTLDQNTVKTITPLQATPAQPDIIPVGSREVLNAQEPYVKNIAPNNFADFIAADYNKFNNWDTLSGTRFGFDRRSATMAINTIAIPIEIQTMAGGLGLAGISVLGAPATAGASTALAVAGYATFTMGVVALSESCTNIAGTISGNKLAMDYGFFKNMFGDRWGAIANSSWTVVGVFDNMKELVRVQNIKNIFTSANNYGLKLIQGTSDIDKVMKDIISLINTKEKYDK
jgi:hypothetical protein